LLERCSRECVCSFRWMMFSAPCISTLGRQEKSRVQKESSYADSGKAIMSCPLQQFLYSKEIL
jgi:hypothetical protein